MLTALTSLFGVTNGCTPPTFFGLKPWYQYLETNRDCEVINFKVLEQTGGAGGRSDIMLIALAMVDNLLRIAGLVAIGFIIYGGILYITSQGSPEGTGKALSTIKNALIGLAISIIAIAIVTYLGSRVA